MSNNRLSDNTAAGYKEKKIIIIIIIVERSVFEAQVSTSLRSIEEPTFRWVAVRRERGWQPPAASFVSRAAHTSRRIDSVTNPSDATGALPRASSSIARSECRDETMGEKKKKLKYKKK